MKTKAEIDQIIEDYITQLSNDDYSFLLNKKRNFGSGVLVSYQSREYVEDNNYSAMIAGLSPFIVEKTTGEIFHDEYSFLGSDELIERFQRSRQNRADLDNV